MKLDVIKKKILARIQRVVEEPANIQNYTWLNDLEFPRNRALEVSKEIRGTERPPAIIINGVMRRSGTNFIGELLSLHPNYCSYPGKIWEVPFLSTSLKLLEAQESFFKGYHRNRERIGSADFLPLFGSAFIAYLHSFVPEHQQILTKVPGVEQLWNFPRVFPYEKLIILQRDGRDLVASTLKSWPDSDFAEVCTQWKQSQELILKFRNETPQGNVCYVKFEDAVKDPCGTVKLIFETLDMDDAAFPYDKVDSLPVKGSSSLRVDGQMTWEGIEKPKSFNPIGRWKEWTKIQKRTFKNICGETLIRSGYAQDWNW